MDYLDWNDRLAAHFFKPEMAGKRVHLYVNEDCLIEVGGQGEHSVSDFVEAVKTGPLWVTRHRQGICQKALQAMTDWRNRNLVYPPYLVYLGFFVLAAGLEGDFAPNAYYPRLRSLLGEEPLIGQYPSFNRMLELWDDLERWSNEDKSGDLGVFTIDIAGNWIHVGLPIAQTLLTEHERLGLRSVFARAGLDATAPPSDSGLIDSVLDNRGHDLRPRTVRVLESSPESGEDIRELLIELITAELRDWDGTTGDLSEEQEESGRIHGGIRICCQVNRVAERITTTLRCRTKHEFPEDGLVLLADTGTRALECHEAELEWSSALRVQSSDQLVDATEFDWTKRTIFSDRDGTWRFSMRGAEVRVFASGLSDGLTGLVEVQQMPPCSPFYFAAHSDCSGVIEKWGKEACKGFEQVSIRQGLPQDWRLYHVEQAINDQLVKDKYPMLSLPLVVRLRLDGGVKVSRGNDYFAFAPPRIIVEGQLDGLKVYCNNAPMQPGLAQDGTFELRELAPGLGTKASIELRRDSEVLARRTVYLVHDFAWQTQMPESWTDQFGVCADESVVTPRITGPKVSGTESLVDCFWMPAGLHGEKRVFFVGRLPGQIVNWPGESLPDS